LRSRSTRTQSLEDTDEVGTTSTLPLENRETLSTKTIGEAIGNGSPQRAHQYNLRSRTRTT
jgi:hypothetical protein